MPLKALAHNCTLKADANEESSFDAMIALLAEAFAAKGATVTVRLLHYPRPAGMLA